MNILLVDADSTIPNLAIMKMSAYYKSKGFAVDLARLEIPYYPSKKKKKVQIPNGTDFFTPKYDKVYCSVLFDGTMEYIANKTDVEFGGTGYSLDKDLPSEIESMKPDYSIYGKVDASYGFISRGCIRKCYFCKVPQKEGGIRQVSNVDDIVEHKKVKFMDNNFLALPNHKEILRELVDKKVRCQFNQGLDIRLLDEENSILLSQMKYIDQYVFAFDDIRSKKIIEKKLEFLDWAKDWGLKFFVYCNKDMPLSESIDRVNWLRSKKILPYFMRDINCWESENKNFYTDFAGWCNQPGLFKYMDFETYIKKKLKNVDRINKTLTLYNGEQIK